MTFVDTHWSLMITLDSSYIVTLTWHHNPISKTDEWYDYSKFNVQHKFRSQRTEVNVCSCRECKVASFLRKKSAQNQQEQKTFRIFPSQEATKNIISLFFRKNDTFVIQYIVQHMSVSLLISNWNRTDIINTVASIFL